MNIVLFYVMALGFGLLGCLAAISRNPGVNKAASVLHYLGLLVMVIVGWMEFDIFTMLGGVLTVFLVGMITSYIVLKAKKKKQDK